MATSTLPIGRRHIDPHSQVESQTRTRNPPRVEVYTHGRTHRHKIPTGAPVNFHNNNTCIDYRKEFKYKNQNYLALYQHKNGSFIYTNRYEGGNHKAKLLSLYIV